MGQEAEASQESFTRRLIEGSQPEQRSSGIDELFLARNVSYVTILEEDVKGMSRLHHHAKMGNVHFIQQLRNRADANATTVGGFTPLHLAAATGHKDVVDEFLLMDYWPNLKVEVTTSDGITALHLAGYGGYDSIVISLLQRYEKNSAADVNARDNVLGRTALHYAVGGGHQNIVEKLIRFPGIHICPRDYVQNLTPLLMEVMKPRGICNLVLVRKLIDAGPYQIDHAVGTDPQPIDTEHWRALCPIELFTSDKVLQRGSGLCPKKQFVDSQQGYSKEYERIEKKMRELDGSSSQVEWERKDTMDRQKLEAESKKLDEDSKWFILSELSPPLRNSNGVKIMDRYLMYECSMGGHTIFHLAATQDNAEVLSFLLLNYPSADVNILTADGHGMSPLHCAIRAESMETFDVLISHREVDVNAVLKASISLARPPWTGLTLHSWWEVKNSQPYRFYKESCKSDTPLHLAIRCCTSWTLRTMVMKFCNHPRFKPSIYNESGVLPLDLAWLRSSCSLQFGNSSVHLHSVLDMLERQPGNEPLMNDVNSMKMGAQTSVNAVLVTATLLGGVTFGALLQPPFGAGFEYNSRAVRFFWTYNCMSFYFSMYTILCCLGTTIVTTQHTQRITGGTDYTMSASLRVFYANEQAQLVVPLILCVVSGVGAFVGAGYANLPPDTRTLMLVCTIWGLVLVFIQAVLRIFLTVKFYLDVKLGTKTWFYNLQYLVSFLSSPRLMVCTFFLPKPVNLSIPIDQNDYSREWTLAILALHVYGIVGMTIYSII